MKNNTFGIKDSVLESTKEKLKGRNDNRQIKRVIEIVDRGKEIMFILTSMRMMRNSWYGITDIIQGEKDFNRENALLEEHASLKIELENIILETN